MWAMPTYISNLPLTPPVPERLLLVAPGRFAASALVEPLQDHKECRDKDHRKASRSYHAGKHADPEGFARICACSRCKHKRQDAKDEGEGRHQDWPETYPRCVNRGL